MTRTNQVLSLALVVQIVIGVFLFIPDDSDTNDAAGPLLAEFEADQVVGLTIQDADDNTTLLHKNAQDDWVLPDNGDYPVTASKVQTLLDQIEGINRDRLIAQNSSSHNRLGVGDDDYERLIQVELADGDTQSIYLGTSSGTSAAHVRLKGENDVYLTSELAAWEVSSQLSSWVDTMYFSLTSDDIVTIQIENENGAFALQKSDEAWTLADLGDDETFDSASITSILSSVSTVRLAEPLGIEADPAWSMDEPVAKITVTIAEEVVAEEDDGEAVLPSLDELLPTPLPESEELPLSAMPTSTPAVKTVEKTYELIIGQALEDGNYPLISSESEFYVAISASTANGFLTLARENFLVETETMQQGNDTE